MNKLFVTPLGFLLLAALVGKPLHAEPPITAAAFVPDGKQVVIGSQQGIEILSWPNLVSLRAIPTSLTHVHDLEFSPDGRVLLVAGGSPAEEGGVEVLSWPEGKTVRRQMNHADVVYRVAWSPRGQQWATAGADGVCQTFAADTGERRVRFEGHSRAVLSLGYLSDGNTLVSVGVDQTLRLWNGTNGQHLRTLDNHVRTVNDVAVRPAGTAELPLVVATASDDSTVRFWQPTIGRLMRFVRLPSIPRAITWSLTGERLWVGCDDGRVRLVDLETAEVVNEGDGLSGRVYVLERASGTDELVIAGPTGCRTFGVR